LALKKIFFDTLKRYVIWLGAEIKEKRLNYGCCCVNGKVNESGQIRLLTFGENSSRRMRELGSSFLIVIVFLEVS
jgi:hypothetical protein